MSERNRPLRRSYGSAESTIPARSWCHTSLPAAASPLAVPYRTSIDPASVMRAHALARDAGSEVVAAVAVEVASAEGVAEAIARLGRAGDTGATLVPELVARVVESARRAVQHVDRADLGDAGDAVPRCADREVGGAGAVEPSRRECRTEPVVRLSASRHAGLVLRPELVACGRQAGRRPSDHVDAAGVGDIAEVLARYAHRHVEKPVAVEVSGGECEPKRSKRSAVPRTSGESCVHRVASGLSSPLREP